MHGPSSSRIPPRNVRSPSALPLHTLRHLQSYFSTEQNIYLDFHLLLATVKSKTFLPPRGCRRLSVCFFSSDIVGTASSRRLGVLHVETHALILRHKPCRTADLFVATCETKGNPKWTDTAYQLHPRRHSPVHLHFRDAPHLSDCVLDVTTNPSCT